MKMLSGECALIIDGQRFDGCTCALEAGSPSARSFGFLSAPSEVLARVKKARLVELGFRHHDHFEITLLANNAGVALIAVANATPIRVTLSLKRWITVVEGRDVREVCIRAEKELWQSGLADEEIQCQVLGADQTAAARIAEYVRNVQLSMRDPDHMPGSQTVIHDWPFGT
jgi:hypothetical protein